MARETKPAKQIFRLEWDNWEIEDGPNNAAYPHWQFDTWLTASSAEERARLHKQLTIADADTTPLLFESAELQLHASEHSAEPDRPDLSWFTRFHFPSIAPWNDRPILDAEETPSHRSLPKTPTELETWVESAMRYIPAEVAAYGCRD
jgi:hypothetical protein